MRIDMNRISPNRLEVEQSVKSQGTKTSSAPVGTEDRATLSSDAVAVNSLQQQALAQPAVRADKVAALKQQIQSGNYKLEPDQIAQAMRENGI